MYPEPVPRLQVGDFGNGQSHSGALHPDINLRPDEIEGGTVGAGRAGEGQQDQKKPKHRPRLAASQIREQSGQGDILTDLRLPFGIVMAFWLAGR